MGDSKMYAGLLLVSLIIALVVSPEAIAQDDEAYRLSEQDWPCHGRYRLEFDAGSFWSGPGLDADSAGWSDDPRLRELVERLAAPDTTLEPGTKMIANFAADLPPGGDRDRVLTRLFHGVLDEMNLYRRFMLEGIVGFMARRELVADVLAETEVELQSLPPDGTAETAARRKALEQRRFWQARAFEGAEGESRFLCQRLTSLEAKLGALARAIASHLQP